MSAEDPQREEVEAVVAELGEAGQVGAVDERLAAVAPQLESILDDALRAGGWFDEAHESMVQKIAAHQDPAQRVDELRNFVVEQTRLGMLVGVAVGWEIAERLAARRSES